MFDFFKKFNVKKIEQAGDTMIVDTVESLEADGKNLISVFTNTIEGLRKLNERILFRRQYHADQMVQHQKSHDTLLRREDQNKGIIEKISHILS